MGRRVLMLELTGPIQLPPPHGNARILREGEDIWIEEESGRFLVRAGLRRFGVSEQVVRCCEYEPAAAGKGKK